MPNPPYPYSTVGSGPAGAARGRIRVSGTRAPPLSTMTRSVTNRPGSTSMDGRQATRVSPVARSW